MMGVGVMKRPAARQWPCRPWSVAAVMLALAAPGARAQEQAGYVASVHGAWFSSARPSQPVSPGRVLSQGETVWAASRSSPGAYLTAVLRDGSRLALNCAVPGDCDRRHTLRVREGLLQDVARVVDAVLGLVRRDPDRFVSLISRADPPGPADAVLAPQGVQIDLGPALAAVPPGHYRARLVRLVPGSGCERDSAGGLPSHTPSRGLDHAAHAPQAHANPANPQASPGADAAWSAGRPMLAAAPPPGLYLLCLGTAGGGGVRESWVLVAPPGDHAAIAAEFARAREIVSGWTGFDAAHDGRVFLRAYLASLAAVVTGGRSP